MNDQPELPENAVTVVREFFAAMEVGAVDEALELLDPEIVWKNAGLPTVRGKKRVAGLLRGLDRPQLAFSADMHHIAGDGDIVLTDRTDFLRLGPVTIEFWVTGTFELRAGRIVLWDDRFSMGNVLRGTVVGAARAILRR
ncbi:limonene-1,2-epoxide hydrolase [Nocardia neocaledoniensis NBRC 108232]|uniref:Limonene-1,2-epoxide hydrolase n=1 Tax=Nocardia neocaledoniensis TaxID=236511 RepID=A0A317NX95_9NOCA|nr:limonene-1,2-epoxide hydrolase family protein [Nocardia neocaledoniensis]PWV79583.1 limonene-1,2-epoxide hydrolase [Nocardia neocaledoniensis]GEM29445.1 limonene-1,2-epoxide hydrolase [Nocardia neocaledoniensis NBRC 108232]